MEPDRAPEASASTSTYGQPDQTTDTDQRETEAELDARIKFDRDNGDEGKALGIIGQLGIYDANGGDCDELKDAELQHPRYSPPLRIDIEQPASLDGASIDREAEPSHA